MQHDYEITVADANTGVTMRAAINAALQALATMNEGPDEPTVTYPSMPWPDTTNNLLKIRNPANNAWVTIGKLDEIYLGLAALAAGNDFTASQKLKGDALLWRFKDTGDGGGEFGIRSDGNALEIVRNTATEGSPTWTVVALLGTALDEKKGDDIASASSIDLGAATGNYVEVTGTTTITGLGTAPAGARRIVNFADVLTLTHNAVSMILPTGASITTAAGDVAMFISLGSGNWRCIAYLRADGHPLAGGSSSVTAPVRQTVLSSAIDSSGLPNFISAGTGLAVNIAATATPIRISFAAGFDEKGAVEEVGSIEADTTIEDLTASKTNFLYAERNSSTGVITLGATTVPPRFESANPFTLTTKMTPTMTGASAPSGTASASSENGAYSAWKAFDRNTGTFWLSNNTTSGYLRYQFPLPVIITSYGIQPDSSAGTAAPKDWTLRGSNDGSDWTTLDTQSEITSWSGTTEKTYNISNTDAYLYYELLITANNGAAYIDISEFNLYGLDAVDHWFNLADMMMYQWVTSAWTEGKQIVFLGEAVTDGSAVTSVINYALRGEYTGNWITPIFATNTALNFNHNIGTTAVDFLGWEGKCIVADLGYAAGEIVPIVHLHPSFYAIPQPSKGRNTFNTFIYSGGNAAFTHKTTGIFTVVTSTAYWAYRIKGRRSF